MKKERTKGFISGMVVSTLIFSLVGTAVATVGKRTAELDYNDIKITVDGQQVTPTDAAGNPLEPFAINGTTYLPVRAVGNTLGVGVEWDGSTGTVQLTRDWSTYDAVLTMGYFKTMEDGFDSLEDHFAGFVDKTYAILGGEAIVSGPYQGMSYYDAMAASIDDKLELAEAHYALCNGLGLLTQDDIQWMADYRRLAGLAKNGYTVLGGNPTEMAVTNITGSAIQNSGDCMMGTMTASSRFWEIYQGA